MADSESPTMIARVTPRDASAWWIRSAWAPGVQCGCDKGNGQIGHAAENTSRPGLFQQEPASLKLMATEVNIEPKCFLRVLQ